MRTAARLVGVRGQGNWSSRWSASSTKRSVLQAAARWPSAPTARLRTARRGLLSCGSRQCRRLAWKAPRGAPSLGSQTGRQEGPTKKGSLGQIPLLSWPLPWSYGNPMALGRLKGAGQLCGGITVFTIAGEKAERGRNFLGSPRNARPGPEPKCPGYQPQKKA